MSSNISQRQFDEAFTKRLQSNGPTVEALLEEFVDILRQKDGTKEKRSGSGLVISAVERLRPGSEAFPLTRPK